MTAKGSRTTRSSPDDVRLARIRAAGVLQSVIASGAPMDDWVRRSKYGLRVVNYLTRGLLGEKPAVPQPPQGGK